MHREMFDTVSRYIDASEMVLLFGDNTLPNENNEAIFKAFYKYIHQTKRFSAGN